VREKYGGYRLYEMKIDEGMLVIWHVFIEHFIREYVFTLVGYQKQYWKLGDSSKGEVLDVDV